MAERGKCGRSAVAQSLVVGVSVGAQVHHEHRSKDFTDSGGLHQGGGQDGGVRKDERPLSSRFGEVPDLAWNEMRVCAHEDSIVLIST